MLLSTNQDVLTLACKLSRHDPSSDTQGAVSWVGKNTMDISLKLVCVERVSFFFLLSPHFNFLDSARAETIATQATLKRALSGYPKERTDFSEK